LELETIGSVFIQVFFSRSVALRLGYILILLEVAIRWVEWISYMICLQEEDLEIVSVGRPPQGASTWGRVEPPCGVKGEGRLLGFIAGLATP
jgi:hypothetical protein